MRCIKYINCILNIIKHLGEITYTILISQCLHYPHLKLKNINIIHTFVK